MAQQQFVIRLSYLHRDTRDRSIIQFFASKGVEVLDVQPDFDDQGKYLKSCTVTFPSLLHYQRALLLNGVEITDGHPLAISVFDENGVLTTLFVKLENVAPQVKKSNVARVFTPVTRAPFLVHLPLMDRQNNKSGKQSKGFAFVYLKSLQDYRGALGLRRPVISGETVNVVAGLFRA